MKSVKRTIVFTVALLACAGIYGALRNLPIVSGCAFYGECPEQSAVASTEQAAPVAQLPLGAAIGAAAP